MHNNNFNRVLATLLSLSLCAAMVSALAPQGLSGGARAFQGQDIMGGAAIVFKRPQRVRDLIGGASLLVVKRSPKPAARPVEVAETIPPIVAGHDRQSRAKLQRLPSLR